MPLGHICFCVSQNKNLKENFFLNNCNTSGADPRVEGPSLSSCYFNHLKTSSLTVSLFCKDQPGIQPLHRKQRFIPYQRLASQRPPVTCCHSKPCWVGYQSGCPTELQQSSLFIGLEKQTACGRIFKKSSNLNDLTVHSRRLCCSFLRPILH